MLQDIRKDGSCMFPTTDKWGALVSVDKVLYIEKYMALLDNEDVYKECRDNTKSMHYNVLKKLIDLKTSIGDKFKEQYNKICSQETAAP